MDLASSGKSTIVEHFVSMLKESNISILHYDDDKVRDIFGKDFGFPKAIVGGS